jgi:ABC-2 type transport system permease protein
MWSLFKKEFNEIICSATGWCFAAIFAIVPGLFLWFFPGNFNLPDSGYADLGILFQFLSILLLVMLPALSMRIYADEKRLGTWDLLQSRPVSLVEIFQAKFLSVWLFSAICILPTFVSVLSIWQLGFPKGNLDLGQVGVGYFSLFLLSAVYSAIGLFASSQTRSAVAAFILGVVINFTVFYGFNFLSGLFLSGASQVGISDIGLSNHFEETNKGVLHLNSVLVFALYFFIFAFLTVSCTKQEALSKQKRLLPVVILAVLLILGNGFLPNISKDFTSDKQYTLSDYSQKVLNDLKKSNKKFDINLYLDGDLNSSFLRLRKQIDYLLNDANRKSGYRFKINYVNPLQIGSVEKVYRQMADRGMKGIMLNETDRNGKVSRQLIFPYLEIIHEKDTLLVNVLKNIPGNTAEDNLKASAENLEYELIDALGVLTDKEPRNIAFIEGHNELPRPYLYDAEEALAKYYSINRGEIVNDLTALAPFKVVVVAGPTQKYTEQQKYILDQYIMRGGRVLWLLDGVYFSEEQLASQGKSATVKNQNSLDDLLFTYGVRVNPVLVQDEQSASLLVNSGKDEKQQSSVIPWYFCPLLIPSQNNPITKDIALVKAPYVSSIDLIRQPAVQANVLLTTSDKAHLVKATEEVNFDVENIRNSQSYFNQKFLIASVSLEGKFTSAYLNRLIPDSIQNGNQSRLNQSAHSKMIVVSSSSIIRNELAGQGDQTQVVPLGFDRTSGRQFGNKDFIVNAVNWLANDDNLLLLRKKQQQLRLLDKVEIQKSRTRYVAVNLIFPILLLGGYIGIVLFRRKKKYEFRTKYGK